jgi:hypothetical protein
LDIERDDIDGTVLQFGGAGYRSIVLFDNVPGGAGHTRRISTELEKVMEAAFTIADNCPGCSRDQSCNACLRNFRNQYAHDLLKRGPVADSLGKILSSVYRRNEEGFFPLGMTDRGRWLEQLFRRSYRLDLVFGVIPLVQDGQGSGKEWYSIIQDLIGKGTNVRLFFKQIFDDLRGMGPDGKVALHSLAAFSQSPNIDIFTISERSGFSIGAYVEIEEGAYVVRWPRDKNPFEGSSDIEVSVLGTFTSTMKEAIENLANDSSTRHWYLEDFNNLLQGTRVIPIKGVHIIAGRIF